MTDYDKIEQVKHIILDFLAKMEVSGTVEFEESITKGLVFNIFSPDSYVLIGRQGATLHSLQILIQALAGKRLAGTDPLLFTIDVDDYKRKREWYLKETARQASEQVKTSGRSAALEPMPSYERRYIHSYLQEHEPTITTESIGEDPYRKIIIKLKKPTE